MNDECHEAHYFDAGSDAAVFRSTDGTCTGEKTSPLDADTIVVEAYVYFYPLVLMDITRLQSVNFEKWDGKSISAPMNTFGHFRRFPAPDWKAIVRPNFDALYSMAWLDLTKETHDSLGPR